MDRHNNIRNTALVSLILRLIQTLCSVTAANSPFYCLEICQRQHNTWSSTAISRWGNILTTMLDLFQAGSTMLRINYHYQFLQIFYFLFLSFLQTPNIFLRPWGAIKRFIHKKHQKIKLFLYSVCAGSTPPSNIYPCW